MEDGTTRFSSDGKPIYQLMNVSSFSEYTVVPWHSCTKVK
jgi:Zn-dependent alcohol dehydrogenase